VTDSASGSCSYSGKPCRAALTCAVDDETIARNPVNAVTMAKRPSSWSSSLGLRRGEVLGLAWDQVDLDEAELYAEEQFQRVRGKLVRREVKTETSEAPMRLPDMCATALKLRKPGGWLA
jgi:integrase